jgi:Acyl-CoA dehydrogenase, C-terminal domain
VNAETGIEAQRAVSELSTEPAAFKAAFESGTTADPYAAIEYAIAAEALAGHDGDEVIQARAVSPIALLVTGPSGQTVAVGSAARLLAVGSPLVLYGTDEVTRRPLESLSGEELHAVDVGAATGRVLCARSGCPTCESAVTRLRCRAGAYLCGLSQGAIDAAVQRVKTRAQFGRPIGENQAVAFQLAALTARVTAMHALGEHIATRIQAGQSEAGDGPLRDASWLLAGCAELAVDATAAALHLHGAFGLLTDQDAQRFYRKACGFSVRHGTPAKLRLAHSTRKRASR